MLMFVNLECVNHFALFVLLTLKVCYHFSKRSYLLEEGDTLSGKKCLNVFNNEDKKKKIPADELQKLGEPIRIHI